MDAGTPHNAITGPSRQATAIPRDAEGFADRLPCVVYQLIIRGDGSRAAAFVTGGAWSLLGLDPRAISADPLSLHDRVHPDDRERVAAHLLTLRAAGASSTVECRFVKPSGETVWLRDHGAAGLLPSGELAVEGVITDITAEASARDALGEAQRRLALHLDNSPLAVIEWDSDLRVVRWSRSAERMFGWTQDEVLGLGLFEFPFVHPDDLERIAAGAATITGREGNQHRTSNRNLRKDGAVVHCDWSNSLLRDEQGRVRSILSVAADVTEREVASAALREAHLRLSAHVAHSPLAVIEWDRDMRIVQWSGSAEAIFGWSASEAIGRAPADLRLVYEEDQAHVDQIVRNFADTSRNFVNSANRNYRKDGAVLHCRWHNSIHRDGQGRVITVLSLVEDVTEAQHALEALRESEARYRMFVTTTQEGVWVIDEHGFTTFVNPKMCSMLGVPAEAMMGRSFLDFMTPEDQVTARDNFRRREMGIAEAHDFRFRRADGGSMWAIVSTNPIFDSSGAFRGALGLITDITQRKHLENQLAAENRIFEIMSVGAEVDRVLSALVRSFESVTSGAMGAVMLLGEDGQTLRGAAAPSAPSGFLAAFDGVRVGPDVGSCGASIHNGRVAITSDIERDPRWEPYRATARAFGLRACWSCPIMSHGGRAMGSLAFYFSEPREPGGSDLATLSRAARLAAIALERAAAERALRESEERYRLIADNSIDMISRHAPDGTFLYASPAAASLLGRHPSDLDGVNPYDDIHPDDQPVVQATHERVLGNSPHSVLVYRRRHADGRWVWLESTVKPILGESGAIKEILVVSRDITSRKAAEDRLRMLNRELDHRVKNNLAAILALAEHTRGKPASIDAYIADFRGRIHAMARMQDMLRLAADRIPLDTLIRRSLEVHFLGDEPQITIMSGGQADLDPRAASVLNMALHELATNAIKYGALSTPRGRVVIRWETLPDGALRILWQEGGGPTVVEPESHGFGANVVLGSVRYELAAEASWIFAPDGLRWEVVIPASSLFTLRSQLGAQAPTP